MRHRPGRPVVTVLMAVAAVVVAGCHPATDTAIRIGVLADCVGFARNLGDTAWSGAQLPLLARGAPRLGPAPSDGVGSAQVAGRDVELVRGCTEGGDYASQIAETRRLVEAEGVAAVVGGTWPGDGLALRDIAHGYPDVAFVPALAGPREVTLQDRAPNLVRVAADFAQSAYGLGEYAARDLGWRRATLLVEQSEVGWQGVAAFLAQFCAAGGRAVQLTVPWDAKQTPAMLAGLRTDGIVVLASPFSVPAGVLWDVAARHVSSPDRLLLGPGYATATGQLDGFPASLTGVVGSSPWPAADSLRSGDYLAAYRAAFPELAGQAASELVVGYRDAVQAVLDALAVAGTGGAAMVAALAQGSVHGVDGDAVVGPDGQVAVTTRLVRYAATAGGPPEQHEIRAFPGVDQTLHGLLAPGYRPHAGTQRCPPGVSGPTASSR